MCKKFICTDYARNWPSCCEHVQEIGQRLRITWADVGSRLGRRRDLFDRQGKIRAESLWSFQEFASLDRIGWIQKDLLAVKIHNLCYWFSERSLDQNIESLKKIFKVVIELVLRKGQHEFYHDKVELLFSKLKCVNVIVYNCQENWNTLRDIVDEIWYRWKFGEKLLMRLFIEN